MTYLNGSDEGIDEIFYANYLKKFMTRESRENALRERLRSEREGSYLFRNYPWVPYFDDFAKIAKEENKNIAIAEEFKMHKTDGDKVYILYKVSDVILR